MSTSRLVGRYKLIGVVGKGGFGIVEEYQDLLTNEHVAIKTIPARFVNQESKRLVREIDTMTFLHDAHPHVIGYFSMFVTPCVSVDGRSGGDDDTHYNGSISPEEVSSNLDVEGSEYINLDFGGKLIKHHHELEAEVGKIKGTDEFNLHIVMPLMKGDLLYFIKHASSSSPKLSMTEEFIEQVAVVFAFQICFGLDYLHKCNIVHRDMKPENVLVRLHGTNPYESTALIADLGLARDAEASDTFYVCTRYYRPPEIITNVSKGETSIDVWSLGCIFFEMVTGRALFTVNSALNEHGVWEGQRASTQLEVILNIVGTPSHEEVRRFMPVGNAQLYLLRSVSRPSRLVEIMENNWRLRTTRDRQIKWMDLISRCLAFFPEQRPSCEDLCRHQLFRDCNVFYGENVKQHPARIYRPTQAGTLVVENKQIVLHLVMRALEQSSPLMEEEGTEKDEWSEEGGDLLFCEEEESHLNNDEILIEHSNPVDSVVTKNSTTSRENTPYGLEEEEIVNQLDFPNVNDPELRQRYGNWGYSNESLDDVISRLLNDLQYYTHDPERSEQLRVLLNYFTSLR
ncbi:putative protein kinase [Trypanosoma theileri]|uniref:Protein kinase domain-containing protein n=1 Tax=Trypanosoma theileri TaxID=67003 RepID=A0A1X0P0K0_9TRYP|nr:putative protein kinase [Trypanosoma theileri]ORC90476.1 putative protein kinase [Trypanosoma theileri]